MDYKKGISSQFSAIFGEGDEEAKETIASKWGWYHTLIQLAQEDFIKIEAITKKPITEVLYHLAYLNDVYLSKNNSV